MEGEHEIDVLHHFSHAHPLTLIEASGRDICFGCRRMFTRGEVVFGCSQKCGYDRLLHQECAEMPREIRHPIHPQHTMVQKIYGDYFRFCVVCKRCVLQFGYLCTSLDCGFLIHLGCGANTGMMMNAADDEEEEKQKKIQHPSHPEHELRLLRRPRHYSFSCDACGTMQKENSSYVCTSITCHFWIHDSCASLPSTTQREHLHHHPLSLVFRIPIEYIKYEYRCDICSRALPFRHWVYHVGNINHK